MCALLAGEPVPVFEESPEAYAARVHPDSRRRRANVWSWRRRPLPAAEGAGHIDINTDTDEGNK
jgi:hypothetical protein